MDTPETTAPDAEVETAAAALAEPLPGDIVDERTGEKWSPARPDEEGIYREGEYPLNHRLRSEALAKDGKDEDPDGIVSKELIADAAARLERDAAARPPVNAKMRVADLEKIAEKEGVDLSSASNNDDRVRLIEAARAGTSGTGTTGGASESEEA